jgi:hypothetical protein
VVGGRRRMREQPHEASRRNEKIRPPKENRWLPRGNT